MARTEEERKAAKLEREEKAARIKAEMASLRATEPKTTKKQYADNQAKRAAQIKKAQKRQKQKKKAAALIAELKKIAGIPERESGSLEKFDRLNMVEETEKTGFNPRSEDYKSGISTPLKGVALAKGGMTKKYGYMGGGKVYGQPRKANYKAG